MWSTGDQRSATSPHGHTVPRARCTARTAGSECRRRARRARARSTPRHRCAIGTRSREANARPRIGPDALPAQLEHERAAPAIVEAQRRAQRRVDADVGRLAARTATIGSTSRRGNIFQSSVKPRGVARRVAERGEERRRGQEARRRAVDRVELGAQRAEAPGERDARLGDARVDQIVGAVRREIEPARRRGREVHPDLFVREAAVVAPLQVRDADRRASAERLRDATARHPVVRPVLELRHARARHRTPRRSCPSGSGRARRRRRCESAGSAPALMICRPRRSSPQFFG